MALLPRSTSEFDAIRAKLAAYLPYRVVSEVLGELLPVTGGSTHTTIRNRTFFTAERITQAWTASNSKVSPLPATELTLGLDSAFIRSTTPKTARHHMVLVGNIEKGCTRRPFAGIQSDEPQITRILRAHLNHMGYRDDTTLTVLTDGDAGLRGLARTATKTNIVPVLDWFHIAMRIQHMKQAAKGFKTRVRTHVEAKKAIQEELEHLHWRLWHGRTDAVDKSLKRLVGEVRRFRHYIKRNWRMMEGPRTFWAMLHELKRYVKNNDVVITDYHRRQRDGSRVATSLVESAVNSLVNQRMNKRRQMRWTEYGAHQLLQVRTAVVNGEFERLTCPSETSPVSHVDALPMAA